MATITVTHKIRSTLVGAGIDVGGFGTQALRNTFALEELRYGATPDQIQKMLGLIRKGSAKRLCSAIAASHLAK